MAVFWHRQVLVDDAHRSDVPAKDGTNDHPLESLLFSENWKNTETSRNTATFIIFTVWNPLFAEHLLLSREEHVPGTFSIKQVGFNLMVVYDDGGVSFFYRSSSFKQVSANSGAV